MKVAIEVAFPLFPAAPTRLGASVRRRARLERLAQHAAGTRRRATARASRKSTRATSSAAALGIASAALGVAVALSVACPARAAGNPRRTPVVRAVEKTRPAVVNVYTETIVETPFRPRFPWTGDPFFDDFFSQFFGPGLPPARQKRTSLGSGVIVDRNGTIITNEHVIVRASNIRVMMADRSEYPAKLIGADSDSDLAVLKIEADKPLPVVPFARDDKILIGETVIAIGNPYGLSHTVTVGVVSAVGRTIQAGDIVYHDFIQTDASINPGNSGGPLINVLGELIGINTAIYREGEGIGFAIPVYRVRNIVEQILQGGVKPPWVGIAVQDLTPDLAFHFGVEPGSGVVVSSVEEGSPADRAGIKPGQIIVRVEDEKVPTTTAFARHLRGLAAGDRLRLTLLSDGKQRRVVLELVALPNEVIDRFAWKALGVRVADAPGQSGVIVREVRRGGPAAEIGMRPGDAITGLGGRPIANRDEFRRRLATFRNSHNVLLSVVRGRRLYRVTVPLAR